MTLDGLFEVPSIISGRIYIGSFGTHFFHTITSLQASHSIVKFGSFGLF